MMKVKDFIVRSMVASTLLVCTSVCVARDGAWHSFVYEKPRTTSGALFADLGEKRNRVSPDEFLRQLNKHGGYEFGSVDEAETYFAASGTVEIRLCDWDMKGIPKGTGIMRTDAKGTTFDVWRREREPLCKRGERFVYDNGVPKFSLYCGNVIVNEHLARAVRVQSISVPVVCQKRVTPSYRSAYVGNLGSARNGALIENECDSVHYEAYREGE